VTIHNEKSTPCSTFLHMLSMIRILTTLTTGLSDEIRYHNNVQLR